MSTKSGTGQKAVTVTAAEAAAAGLESEYITA